MNAFDKGYSAHVFLFISVNCHLESNVHHIVVYAITKLPRFYADCHSICFAQRTYVETKIANSASLPMLTYDRIIAVQLLGNGSGIGQKLKLSTKSSRLHVLCKLCRRHSKAVPSYSTCSSAQTKMLAFVYFLFFFND